MEIRRETEMIESGKGEQVLILTNRVLKRNAAILCTKNNIIVYIQTQAHESSLQDTL